VLGFLKVGPLVRLMSDRSVVVEGAMALPRSLPVLLLVVVVPPPPLMTQ
jgi:hypothetical protein